MAQRTDPHRKGAIIPAEYRYVLSYNLSTTEDGWPVPSFGVNCELDHRTTTKNPDGTTTTVNGAHAEDGRCCVIGLLHVSKVKMASHGGTGKCSVCGARFIYGDVWEHEPTGEHIHLGHECADKYNLLADRSAFELEAGRRREAAAVVALKAERAAQREGFLDANPGLREALALKDKHHILADLADKFTRYGLSEKQVAFALKLADEVRNPKPKEVLVPAPVASGRVEFTGTVVSVKVYESAFGECLKMTLKVPKDGGFWLAWGTCPRNLDVNRGDTVSLKASLKAGRDDHFALFSRPTNAVVVEKAPVAA